VDGFVKPGFGVADVAVAYYEYPVAGGFKASWAEEAGEAGAQRIQGGRLPLGAIIRANSPWAGHTDTSRNRFQN